ncbi:TonB-dependent receptor [Emticicia sp. CRIBPO]|uniref:outer membrane beta-barrel family protein n=1 Tax=Emticicia sp. CRIBPO TaxID=2683258 RepID=UPI0014134C62|nr:outer membrane beta-barrel family protein [Emticicia sp. CRIBPO]NBA87870.1 TonB-dependent receptor [Emticicia sp. CRIBPO]
MKKLLLYMALICLAGNLYAQKSKITGYVIDSAGTKAVEFATVALLKEGKPIDGSTCDETGKFTFHKVAEGLYQLKISFMGYNTRTVQNVLVSPDKDTDLGAIKLGQNSIVLDEIKVVDQKSLFEDKPDRLIYNAEKDISVKGGNAADVLRKIPSISVDMDGNIELRGSGNIKVLINNKPSNIMARSVADVLKQIPADIISKVEVITSPSAKYDAEGTAGVINIITKSNNLEGMNGSASVAVRQWGDNLNGSINYRKKKVGISTRGGYNRWLNQGMNIVTRQSAVENITSNLTQTSDFKGVGQNGYGNITLDWDIDSLNRISGGLNLYDGKNGMNFDYLNDFSSSSGAKQIFSRDLFRVYDWQGKTINLDYTKTFRKPKREFNFLTLYSTEGEDGDYHFDQFEKTELPTYREKSLNISDNREGTIQMDFTNPIDSTSTMEFGLKSILRSVKSDYTVQNSPNGSDPFKDVPELANIFNYSQQVASGYMTYSYSGKKKWSMNAGFRYEHTFIQAEFLAGKVAFTNNYGNIIPNISFSKTLPKDQKLRISYSQRIQRPMLWFLNPYVNQSEPKSTFSGNPYLKPELTHSAELNYNVYLKQNSITAAFFMRQTNNAFERIREFDGEGNSHTTFQNIAKNSAYGVNLSGTIKFKKHFSTNTSFNMFYNVLQSPVLQAANQSWMYRVNVNATYDFGKGYKAQLFGFFNSPRVMLQGRATGYRYYNLAIQKEFTKQKINVSAGYENFFNKSLTQTTTLSSPDFVQEVQSIYFNRGWRMSVSYEFGKLKAQQKKGKKISNDDKASGDGN